MTGRRKGGPPSQPRPHRMRRPARLESARAWLASGGKATVKAYAKRYGVDRYTAHQELVTLGVELRSSDAQWAQRPPPAPRRRRGATGEPHGPSSDWIVFGDQIIFPVGFTAWGFPYGPTIDDLDEEDRAAVLAELGLGDGW